MKKIIIGLFVLGFLFSFGLIYAQVKMDAAIPDAKNATDNTDLINTQQKIDPSSSLSEDAIPQGTQAESSIETTEIQSETTTTADTIKIDPPALLPGWNNVGKPLSIEGFMEHTALAFSSNNIPYFAYSNHENEGKLAVKKFDGSNWTNVGKQDSFTGVPSRISLIVDSNNTPYVAYLDFSNEDKITVKKFDGSSWVNVGKPGSLEGSLEYNSIAFDSKNTLYIAYQDTTVSGRATVSKYDGTQWVNVGTPGFSKGWAHQMSFAIDGNNIPYVAYRDYESDGKATVMKFDGSDWVNVGSPGFSEGGIWSVYLTFDSNNTPFVSYRDVANTDRITVMKFNGSDWESVGKTGFSEIMSEPFFKIDANNVPYVAYQYVKDGIGISVIKKFNGTDWINAETPKFETNSFFITSIDIDSNNNIYTTYNYGFGEEEDDMQIMATIIKMNGAKVNTKSTAIPDENVQATAVEQDPTTTEKTVDQKSEDANVSLESAQAIQ